MAKQTPICRHSQVSMDSVEPRTGAESLKYGETSAIHEPSTGKWLLTMALSSKTEHYSFDLSRYFRWFNRHRSVRGC